MPEPDVARAPGRADTLAQGRQRLREGLDVFLAQAAQGALAVCQVPTGTTAMARGAGHFHMGPELFLQWHGRTQFSLPHAQVDLREMQALVMPPKLLHDEWVEDSAQAAFANLVIYADSQAVNCHLAYQEAPHKPGILHLEQCRHREAARIQDWLVDAALAPAVDVPGTWPLQQRALVLTALSAVRRLLDAPAAAQSSEPPMLAKLRVLVHNQLGDTALSVASLAQRLGCTADYLSHLYSHQTGERLTAYIQQQRLARAARLLQEGDAAIKEVAWYCGFGSASYFIRSFRQHYGVTPQQYRQASLVPVASQAPSTLQFGQ